MLKRFLKITAIIAPMHFLATTICIFLWIKEWLEGTNYSELLFAFLAKLFVQPSTAILSWFGIDLGSSSWGLLFLAVNSVIWGAAIAALLSVTGRRSTDTTTQAVGSV
jgi:hypothetical protein